MQAFIVQKGGSALAFYEELANATSVARVVCLVIQSVLGDLVIVSLLPLSGLALLFISPKIWRLYVVYGQRLWVVIPPLLLVTCYTGMVFSLGFGVVTSILYLTYPSGPSSGRLCRHLVHPEGASRNQHLQRGEGMDNRLFFHDDVFQRHLFR